jgi:hypothetical protein
MKGRTILIAVAAVAGTALAGGGFVAGMSVGENNAKASASASAAAGRTVRGGQFPGGPGANASGAPDRSGVAGQVLSVGADTITVQLGADQGSRIVLVAPSTRVTKTTETDITVSDIKPGDRITVIGQANPDGSLNATTVVVGNLGGALGGRPGASASPSPTPAR